MPNIEDDYSTMKQDDDNKKNIHQDYWLRKLSGELNRSRFQYDYKETVSNVRLIDSVELDFPGIFFLICCTFPKNQISTYIKY